MNSRSRLFFGLNLLAAGSLLMACGPERWTAKPSKGSADIIGGKSAAHQAISHSVVALLAESKGGQLLCTGSILDQETIVTAAHCVDGEPEKLFVIFGNDLKTTAKTNIRSAISSIQSPLWGKQSQEGRGDLALVRFSGGLPEKYVPVQLADRDMNLKPGLSTLLFGYGVTKGGERKGAGILRSTVSKIASQFSPSEFLLNESKSGVCFGDSGGPAFVRNAKGEEVQWGVASSVSSPGCDDKSLHTSLIPFYPWLEQASRELRNEGSDQNTSVDDEDVEFVQTRIRHQRNGTKKEHKETLLPTHPGKKKHQDTYPKGDLT